MPGRVLTGQGATDIRGKKVDGNYVAKQPMSSKK
jgi:hypothetical protein